MIATTQREVAVSQQQSIDNQLSDINNLLSSDPNLDADVQAALDAGNVITLSSNIGENEYGVASREFKDNKFNLEIIISVSSGGQDPNYVAWLDGEELVQLGSLEQDSVDPTEYALSFNSPEDFSYLNRVIISQENNTKIESPTQIIFDGNFK